MGVPELPAIIGEAPAFLETVERVSRIAAAADRPALVVGERGTGKELLTARLHYLSPRWARPLLKVNCAALTETLLESELFGHEAGAFTGAQRQHRGRFERADGGTLVLDEIASASPAVQEKVLRVVEYGELERVGGREVVQVDVRVVGACNVDLPTLAAAGDFRADLLDRLAFEVITLPPLRARQEDILVLARAFAMEMTRALGREAFAGFSPGVRRQLLDHRWPGNVRELRNVVERAVFHCRAPDAPIDAVILDPFASPWRPLPAASAPAAPPPAPVADARQHGFAATVAEFERELLTAALDRARHNQTETARALGLGYHQLRRLLRKHRLAGSPTGA